MRGVLLHGPGDVRVEQRPDPRIQAPTDAIIKIIAACVCGSDLWPYRADSGPASPAPMGHEYVGEVVEVGSDIRNLKVGDTVVGSFMASDNTCPTCQLGYQSCCVNVGRVGESGTQAEYARIPLADGTLVPVPADATSDRATLASLLACSDVFGTGWFAADAANVTEGKTVAVIGDGAVGLLGVLSASQMGAERIIVCSRHADRQAMAKEFGATHIIETRGEEAIAEIKDLTDGFGADSVIEAVGTQQSMQQAMGATRPGGHLGFVGISHDVQIDGATLLFQTIHLHGGPAPVRRYLPDLIDRVLSGSINPGKVFDKTFALADAADAYKAMDQRECIKAMLLP